MAGLLQHVDGLAQGETFGVLYGAGLSHAAGIALLADARAGSRAPAELQAVDSTRAHQSIASLVQWARSTGRAEPVLLTTNHDDLELHHEELRGTLRLHGGLAHRRCSTCGETWLAQSGDDEAGQHPGCGALPGQRIRKRRGEFVGECAMRKGNGAQTVPARDWREYVDARAALQVGTVRLLLVMGLDGSVATSALKELVRVVATNGGAVVFVNLASGTTTLQRALANTACDDSRFAVVHGDVQLLLPELVSALQLELAEPTSQLTESRAQAILSGRESAIAECGSLPGEKKLRIALFAWSPADPE